MLAIGWFGFISDYKSRVEKEFRHELELKHELQIKQRIVTNREAYELQVLEISDVLESLENRLPNQFYPEQMNEDIKNSAADYGIKLLSLNLKEEDSL